MYLEVLHSSLEKHFYAVNKIILSRQDAVTGLLPASTAISAHGDYRDAWVRDNVYSILSVWGLALSYRKYYPAHNRTYLLRKSVIKLMRGLLMAMMRQADKVELFKTTLNPADALHAKYGTRTGLGVVGDHEWGHLQLDATSLFLLMLAQMSASGLHIIYTMDEVDFVQNLVHYISRTYCTPDYGIWERGNKINHGTTEINSSSVGMAKAALEALDGFNLFSNLESGEGIIHVVPSDIARSRVTLEGLLPRESNSKETDGALLSIIGYPAYAVEDEGVLNKTREKIIDKLAGNYGCKRFLLDGHQSSIEDASKLHYEPSELRAFKDIESEWPLFFTYLLLDALMRGDKEDTEKWRKKLQPLFVEQDGMQLLPELYSVPRELIDAEKANPGTQKRVANENLPLVWAQSLFLLSDMILDGILDVSDIDPLNRRRQIGYINTPTPIVSILAQDEFVKEQLHAQGIFSQTAEDAYPVRILQSSALSKLHTVIGENEKLSLSGRPFLETRTITTAFLQNINGQETLFLPYYFNPNSFYLSYDNKLLIEQFYASLKFLFQNWNRQAEPIMLFLVRPDMLSFNDKEVVLEFLHTLQSNTFDSHTIQTGLIKEFIKKAALKQIDNSDINLDEFKLYSIENSNEKYRVALQSHDWATLRTIAESKGQYDERLEDALLDIIISQKNLAVGRAYSEKATFSKPHESAYIVKTITEFSGESKAEGVLTQEIILHLAHLVRIEPKLFNSITTIRPWYFVQLLVGRISADKGISFGEAYERLISFEPSEIYNSLKTILTSLSLEVTKLSELENLHMSELSHIESIEMASLQNRESEVKDWALWRKEIGMLRRLSKDFHKNVWYLLQQCRGLVIGDKYNQDCRIGSEMTLESTPRERNFELLVDKLLQSILAPDYAQLNIEAIESLVSIFKQNPTLKIENDLILDVLIGYGVRISWTKHADSQKYDEQKGQAWKEFYTLSPEQTSRAFHEAFVYLLHLEEEVKL